MLSIIIVNYNQKNFLKQCLKNIEEAKVNISYELIIVDNNSSDSSRDFLSKLKITNYQLPITKQIPNSKLQIILNNINLGFAKAVNQGIKTSQGKYVLILNPDIIVLPGSIEALFRFMENHPDCAIAGPKLLNPNKTVQYSCRRFPKWYISILRRIFLSQLPLLSKIFKDYLMADWDHQANKEVDWLMGAALMARREAIDRVGLMDERYFLYFEDVDWCRLFHQSGWKVFYAADSVMYHFHQRLSAEHSGFPALFSKITWIHIASAIKYFYKWRNRCQYTNEY